MIPGPMDFRGPMMGPRWLQRALQRAHGLQRAHRNDTEISVCGRPKNFFVLFRRSNHNPDKTVAFFREDLFLGGRSHQIQKKPWHIPRPFWSLQNWRCVIFELNPGPRLALGAPVCLCYVKRVNPFQIAMKTFFSVCTEWVFNFRIWTFAKTSWVPCVY